jgi:hypothetical protein
MTIGLSLFGDYVAAKPIKTVAKILLFVDCGITLQAKILLQILSGHASPSDDCVLTTSWHKDI